MKNKPTIASAAAKLKAEAARFEQLAKDAALTALHKTNFNAIDPRDVWIIRDHEMRAETLKAAATLISK